MKKILILLMIATFLGSCGLIEKRKDESLNYRSIVGTIGTVKVTIGGEKVEYNDYVIEYSDSDASTLLIRSPEGKYVYIQGFAVFEFDNFKKKD